MVRGAPVDPELARHQRRSRAVTDRPADWTDTGQRQSGSANHNPCFRYAYTRGSGDLHHDFPGRVTRLDERKRLACALEREDSAHAGIERSVIDKLRDGL